MRKPHQESSRISHESRKRRNEFLIIGITALILAALFIIEWHLPQVRGRLSTGRNLFYLSLINLNVILLLLMLFLIIRNLVKLLFERKRKVLGSKLRTKLVAAFLGISLITAFVLFFVAVGLITNAVEKWFSVQVEQSLKGSLEVAQEYYRDFGKSGLNYAINMADRISEGNLMDPTRRDVLVELLEEKRSEYNLGIVEVFSSDTKMLYRVTDQEIPGNPVPSAPLEALTECLKGNEVSETQRLQHGELIRAFVPVRDKANPESILGALGTSYYLPVSLMEKMGKISEAYVDYTHSKMYKQAIKWDYLMYLLMVTLLIIFLANWVGFYLAKGITVPIQELAEATEKVAQGNLDFRIRTESGDEIGTLVESFNRMTDDLKVSKAEVERKTQDLEKTNVELSQRKTYMEIVLQRVATGVISIDTEGQVSTVNKSAEKILGVTSKRIVGRHYREVLGREYLRLARDLVREVRESKDETIEKQINIRVQDRTLTLLVHLTPLRDEEGGNMGTVAVFDDLSELIKAQRMAAWREVARRIAHEIKNPLTPIQLSAERLRRRCRDRVGEEVGVFDECTKTIIREADGLKNMVNEFSNFARMPAANPVPSNLNNIIQEAMSWYQEVHKNIEFGFERSDDIPVLDLDRDQMRRVITNLFENAIASIDNGGEVRIKTDYDRELKIVSLSVSDNGVGIPEEAKTRLFEPYFSTKAGGTGLGLAIVSSIVSDHHGYIRVRDNRPKGTKFIIELPAKE
jgi:two-component system nitrogen regulation sensor histidine kinase NtrY